MVITLLTGPSFLLGYIFILKAQTNLTAPLINTDRDPFFIIDTIDSTYYTTNTVNTAHPYSSGRFYWNGNNPTKKYVWHLAFYKVMFEFYSGFNFVYNVCFFYFVVSQISPSSTGKYNDSSYPRISPFLNPIETVIHKEVLTTVLSLIN